MNRQGKGNQSGTQLGLWVRNRRKELDLTQEQVAERMGVDIPNNWVTQLETGRRKGLPETDQLIALSEALRVTMTELLQGAGVVPIDIDATQAGADPEVERIVALVRTVNWTPDRVEMATDMLRNYIKWG